MRMLDQASVIAEARRGGNIRLCFKIPTGEEIGVELSPERAAQLSDEIKELLPRSVPKPAAPAAKKR